MPYAVSSLDDLVPSPATTADTQEAAVPVPVPATAGPNPPAAHEPVPVGAPKPLLDSVFGDLWPETGVARR